jgi:hypothetical protein
VNGFQRFSEEECRFLVAGRPPALTIHTLPRDLELRVDQHDRFGAPAAGARHAVLIQDVAEGDSSMHEQVVGFAGNQR